MSSPTIIRAWDSDEQYVKDQATDSSWSHDTAWGKTAALKFMSVGDILLNTGQLFHNDTIADFGGNDGFAAHQFYMRHGIKPMVIDCEPHRIAFAKREYDLSTIQCFIEDIPLSDNSIDWGFCSHTLEHTRDVNKALSEIARVIKRGCVFILPIESVDNASRNIAHAVSCSTLGQWKELLRPYWTIKGSARTKCRVEAQIFAVPRKRRK